MKELILIVYGQLLSLLHKHDKYIFIVGHMRSGSTLLSHILISSKEVYGTGETNRVYHNIEDLKKLSLMNRVYDPTKIFSGKFFLDQINHNHMLPDIDSLSSFDIKFIFLYREPHDTITSILNLSRDFYEDKWSQQMAEDYYISRLDHMKNILKIQVQKSNFILLSYDELVNQSDQSLYGISQFLELENVLKSTYKRFAFTGKRGDPSKKIHSGDIVRKKNKNISKESVSEEVWKAYHDFLNVI